MVKRPQLFNERAQTIITQALAGKPEPIILMVGLRGYFANSFGKKNENDFNVYDDGWLVVENRQIVGRYNANTDPSEVEGRAILQPGLYPFAKGMHKNRIRAFRAFPEGVVIPCKRTVKGKLIDSTCQYINIHDGGHGTWSEGCQTLPGAKVASTWGNQFAEMRDQTYGLMDKWKLQQVMYLLIDVTGQM